MDHLAPIGKIPTVVVIRCGQTAFWGPSCTPAMQNIKSRHHFLDHPVWVSWLEIQYYSQDTQTRMVSSRNRNHTGENPPKPSRPSAHERFFHPRRAGARARATLSLVARHRAFFPRVIRLAEVNSAVCEQSQAGPTMSSCLRRGPSPRAKAVTHWGRKAWRGSGRR